MADDRWLTFDCYGTIADWNAGLLAALAAVGGDQGQALLTAYHQAELILEAGPAWLPYRDVLTTGLQMAARRAGVRLAPGAEAALVAGWPRLPVFADAGPALTALAAAGWKLAILTNCDDDLFATTAPRLPVPFDLVVTAEQVRGYKPDLGHFRRFAEAHRRDAGHLGARRQQLGARHPARRPDGRALGLGRPGHHGPSGQAGRAQDHLHAPPARYRCGRRGPPVLVAAGASCCYRREGRSRVRGCSAP